MFNELLEEMKDVDVVIINSGIGGLNENLEWEKDKEKIDINVLGFVNIAAKQIFSAIKHKKKKVYIPKKWAFIAIFYKIFPEKIYNYFRKVLLR